MDAVLANNVTQFPVHLCECNCGQPAPYGKYAGIPKSREYNRHAKRASRNGSKSDVKPCQTPVQQVNEDQIALLHQKIDRLEEMLKKALAGKMSISPTTEPATIKAIPQAAPLDAPVFDDDFELDVQVSKDDGKAATQNFMNSLVACQSW